jgi:hypothetical protein
LSAGMVSPGLKLGPSIDPAGGAAVDPAVDPAVGAAVGASDPEPISSVGLWL